MLAILTFPISHRLLHEEDKVKALRREVFVQVAPGFVFWFPLANGVHVQVIQLALELVELSRLGCEVYDFGIIFLV
jgi:hypothetical protein